MNNTELSTRRTPRTDAVHEAVKMKTSYHAYQEMRAHAETLEGQLHGRSKAAMVEAATAWMADTWGIPKDLDDEAQARWFERNGMIFAFINSLDWRDA